MLAQYRVSAWTGCAPDEGFPLRQGAQVAGALPQLRAAWWLADASGHPRWAATPVGAAEIFGSKPPRGATGAPATATARRRAGRRRAVVRRIRRQPDLRSARQNVLMNVRTALLVTMPALFGATGVTSAADCAYSSTPGATPAGIASVTELSVGARLT